MDEMHPFKPSVIWRSCYAGGCKVVQSSCPCAVESLQVGTVEFPFNAEPQAKCQISQTLQTSAKSLTLPAMPRKSGCARMFFLTIWSSVSG